MDHSHAPCGRNYETCRYIHDLYKLALPCLFPLKFISTTQLHLRTNPSKSFNIKRIAAASHNLAHFISSSPTTSPLPKLLEQEHVRHRGCIVIPTAKKRRSTQKQLQRSPKTTSDHRKLLTLFDCGRIVHTYHTTFYRETTTRTADEYKHASTTAAFHSILHCLRTKQITRTQLRRSPITTFMH